MKDIREVKAHKEYFTLKEDLREPNENQVWIKSHYNREDKTYTIYNFADVNKYKYIKANKKVQTDITF